MILLLISLWSPPKPVEVAPPKAPYAFVREDPSGTQPKLFVKDAAGAVWNVKFGPEVRTESFCWRIVQACGYFAEPSFFVAEGRIENLRPLKRPNPDLQVNGTFRAARFQHRDPAVRFVPDRNWRWDRPPFAGTKELSGLKVLIMLFSNWDNKDARVGKGGPNTGEFRRGKEQIAGFTDWGSGMGRWGSEPGINTNWNCADFAAQTPQFVLQNDQKQVVFGWKGAINDGFSTGIPPAHIAWLLERLGKIPDEDLRAWLRAAGGSDADVECFGKALRSRIEQLRSAAILP